MEKDNRDIGRKGIQPAKEKQSGKKEEGNVERGEKEISPRAPSQAAREEEGTNPPPSSPHPPLLVLAGEPAVQRWSAFRTLLASQ